MIPERARLDRVSMLHEFSDQWNSPIPEHLTKAGLLVRPNDCGGLKVNVEIGVDRVVSKIIFFQHGIFKFIAPFLDVLRSA